MTSRGCGTLSSQFHSAIANDRTSHRIVLLNGDCRCLNQESQFCLGSRFSASCRCGLPACRNHSHISQRLFSPSTLSGVRHDNLPKVTLGPALEQCCTQNVSRSDPSDCGSFSRGESASGRQVAETCILSTGRILVSDSSTITTDGTSRTEFTRKHHQVRTQFLSSRRFLLTSKEIS